MNVINHLLKLLDVFFIDIHQGFVRIQYRLGIDDLIRGAICGTRLCSKRHFTLREIEQLLQSKTKKKRFIQFTGIENRHNRINLFGTEPQHGKNPHESTVHSRTCGKVHVNSFEHDVFQVLCQAAQRRRTLKCSTSVYLDAVNTVIAGNQNLCILHCAPSS